MSTAPAIFDLEGFDLPEIVDHANETARAVAAPRSLGAWRDLTGELKTPAGTMQLRPLQSRFLCEVMDHGRGGLGGIGVGHGKTLISFLVGTVLVASKTLVLTKAGVVSQTIRELARLRAHWQIGSVEVMSYNALSRPEQSAALSNLARIHGAGLVIVADECHELAAPTSARTKRVGRVLQDFPGVRFVAMSGSLTDRSLWDYAHLAEWALGEGSPLPRTSAQRYHSHVEAWAQCVDPRGRPGSSHWDTVWPLLERWGERVECEHCDDVGCDQCAGTGDGRAQLTGEARQLYAQQALGARMSDCCGVVLSEESSCEAPIEIRLIEPEIPARVQRLMGMVAEGERPDGEVLPDDLSKARVRSTLTMGYYQRWEWPDGEPDDDWLKARRRWNAIVRKELEENASDGYDSPFLVWAEVSRQVRAGRSGAEHAAWLQWEQQRGKPSPPTAAVWIDAFWLRDIRRVLASLQGPTLVWYQSKPVETALIALGLQCYGAGTRIPEDGRTSIGASIKVHGTGRNLQAWSRNLVLEPPASGRMWEQLLGRTHRAGQTAPVVTFQIYAHGAFGPVIESARRNAIYTQAVTKNAQKALLASWIAAPDRAERE